jgi:hypothetical protein
VIRAEKLPDDTSWNPGDMPDMISKMTFDILCIGEALFALKSVDRSYQANPARSDFQIIKRSEKFVITERS